MDRSVSRVLIYRLGSLGDTVVALPALHLVARAFPNAERIMLTNWRVSNKAAAAEEILAHTGLIHRFVKYPVGVRDPAAILGLIRVLRALRLDVLVYLAEPRTRAAVLRDAAFFAICGIQRMIGLPLTTRLRCHLTLPGGRFEHESARLARCVVGLGDARLNDPESWNLHIEPAEAAGARAALDAWTERHRFIAVTVGTKVQVNDWGAANWERALSRLSSHHPDLGLVLIGSIDERENAELAGSGWRGPKTNLCGRLSPRESAAVIRDAVMYAGHDTGPMHLAAAVGVPCIAVFSARNLPGVWFPWGDGHRVVFHLVPCAGCGLEVCIANGKKCIVSISPDEVYEAAAAVLHGRIALLGASS
ncbi:MAG TPA: glycosyltransferase family 9 protein [Candidatus Binataceae bacterium]|nr:glycosyltransferase family 9 protein [Candidatus Binataceae bacterium]